MNVNRSTRLITQLGLAASAAALSVQSASAHDGDHGSSLANVVVHLLTDPYHLIIAMAAAGAVFAIRRVLQRRKRG